ncbi:MAG TPA: hypothetical protein VHX20_11580 [Terracidiphilus sp.]|jgi:hypothetical protein|nr:hypothetical protein [Terracidiphilus sp.]
MKQSSPPPLATWMLGEWNEALAGDLHEEFRAGRSAVWYWRQVLSALLIRGARALRIRRAALLFAALWSMLVPGWLFMVAGIERSLHFNEHLSRMTWPWSTVCDLGLMLAASLLFLWAGILLYLFADLWHPDHFRLRELGGGIAASLPAVLVLWLALIVLPKHFVAVQAAAESSTARTPTPLEAFRMEQRRMVWAAHEGPALAHARLDDSKNRAIADTSPRQAVTDMHVPAVLVRLPFFLVLLCTLRSAEPRSRRCPS